MLVVLAAMMLLPIAGSARSELVTLPFTSLFCAGDLGTPLAFNGLTITAKTMGNI